MIHNLFSLIEKWENVSRKKFQSAEQQDDITDKRPTAKQFIEHGAICYYNCAQQLREVLSSVLPETSSIQGGDQK